MQTGSRDGRDSRGVAQSRQSPHRDPIGRGRLITMSLEHDVTVDWMPSPFLDTRWRRREKQDTIHAR